MSTRVGVTMKAALALVMRRLAAAGWAPMLLSTIVAAGGERDGSSRQRGDGGKESVSRSSLELGVSFVHRMANVCCCTYCDDASAARQESRRTRTAKRTTRHGQTNGSGLCEICPVLVLCLHITLSNSRLLIVQA